MIEADPHFSRIIIWDNSPVPQHSSDIVFDASNLTIKYYHSGKNENLSAIYNKVAIECFDEGASFLTIFDHDSKINSDFKHAIDSSDKNLLLVPKVRSDLNGNIISPRYQTYNYLRNKCNIIYLPQDVNSGPKKSVNFFAVASGLTISNYVWNTGIRFDEALSFYGVDTEFCCDYASKKDQFYLIDTAIEHSASNEIKESQAIMNWRVAKYYEHWRYQLIKYLGIPKPFATIYVSFNYYGYRMRNLFKN